MYVFFVFFLNIQTLEHCYRPYIFCKNVPPPTGSFSFLFRVWSQKIDFIYWGLFDKKCFILTSFQTCMTFFLLRNMKEDILKNVGILTVLVCKHTVSKYQFRDSF